MSETTPQPTKHSRSLGISLGVTEVIYLLGLAFLTPGICLLFGIAWSLIGFGGALLGTAFYIDHSLDKGKE